MDTIEDQQQEQGQDAGDEQRTPQTPTTNLELGQAGLRKGAKQRQ